MTWTGVVSGAWPESLEHGRVADAAFATAYGRVPDRERAWIKKGIAAMFAALGGPMAAYGGFEAGLGHDLLLRREERPLDYVLVVCGPGMLSPMRLAAAVLPALCARVPDIAVVRVGARWPHALLTALELCGVETVSRLGLRAMSGLYVDLAAKGEGAVVLLDDAPAPKGLAPEGMRVVPLRFSGRIGVLADPRTPLDVEALAFAHPDAVFVVHDAQMPCQPPFVAAEQDLDAGLDLGYAAACGDVSRLAAALPEVPLVLGSGRETFWLWPTLSVSVLRRQRLMATVDHRADLGR